MQCVFQKKVQPQMKFKDLESKKNMKWLNDNKPMVKQWLINASPPKSKRQRTQTPSIKFNRRNKNFICWSSKDHLDC